MPPSFGTGNGRGVYGPEVARSIPPPLAGWEEEASMARGAAGRDTATKGDGTRRLGAARNARDGKVGPRRQFWPSHCRTEAMAVRGSRPASATNVPSHNWRPSSASFVAGATAAAQRPAARPTSAVTRPTAPQGVLFGPSKEPSIQEAPPQKWASSEFYSPRMAMKKEANNHVASLIAASGEFFEEAAMALVGGIAHPSMTRIKNSSPSIGNGTPPQTAAPHPSRTESPRLLRQQPPSSQPPPPHRAHGNLTSSGLSQLRSNILVRPPSASVQKQPNRSPALSYSPRQPQRGGHATTTRQAQMEAPTHRTLGVPARGLVAAARPHSARAFTTVAQAGVRSFLGSGYAAEPPAEVATESIIDTAVSQHLAEELVIRMPTPTGRPNSRELPTFAAEALQQARIATRRNRSSRKSRSPPRTRPQSARISVPSVPRQGKIHVRKDGLRSRRRLVRRGDSGGALRQRYRPSSDAYEAAMANPQTVGCWTSSITGRGANSSPRMAAAQLFLGTHKSRALRPSGRRPVSAFHARRMLRNVTPSAALPFGGAYGAEGWWEAVEEAVARGEEPTPSVPPPSAQLLQPASPRMASPRLQPEAADLDSRMANLYKEWAPGRMDVVVTKAPSTAAKRPAMA